MNVYVRELSSAIARAGVECDVFTRAWSPELARCSRRRARTCGSITCLPGLSSRYRRNSFTSLVEEFTEGVAARMTGPLAVGPSECRYDAIHANYRLSGLAGPSVEARARPAARVDLPHSRPGEGRVEPRRDVERRTSSQGRGRGGGDGLFRGGAGIVQRRGRSARRALRGRPRPNPCGPPGGRPRFLRSGVQAPGPQGGRAPERRPS